VQPLSAFLGRPAPKAAPAIDFIKRLTPEQQEASLDFFNILNFTLQFCGRTRPRENSWRVSPRSASARGRSSTRASSRPR
jgi:hypothetical protein